MARIYCLSLLLLLLLLGVLVNTSVIDGSAADVDLSKLRIKELRKMLDERGIECVACPEKADLIEKVKESLHLPLLSDDELAAAKESKEPKKEEAPDSKGGKSKDIEDLIAKLKKEGGPGFQNVKMFSREDLDKMGGFEEFTSDEDSRKKKKKEEL